MVIEVLGPFSRKVPEHIHMGEDQIRILRLSCSHVLDRRQCARHHPELTQEIDLQERRALATSRRGIGRQLETDVLQRFFVPLVNVRISRQRPRRSRFDSGLREPGVANSSQIRQCPFRESSPKLALQSVDFFDGPPLSRRKVSTAGHRRPTDVDFPDCRTRRRTLRTLHGTLHRALVRSHLHRCTRALQQTSQNLATTTVQLSERRGITPRLTRPYLLEHPFQLPFTRNGAITLGLRLTRLASRILEHPFQLPFTRNGAITLGLRLTRLASRIR